jgi:hypothetical protein
VSHQHPAGNTFFETRSHHIAEAGPGLSSSCFSLSSAEIAGVLHNTLLSLELYLQNVLLQLLYNIETPISKEKSLIKIVIIWSIEPLQAVHLE